MKLDPYLVFNGNCAEAFRTYERCLRGQIEMMMTFGQSPEAANMPRELHDQVMHVSLLIEGQRLMGSDSPPEHYEEMKGISVSIGVEDPAEAERIYRELSAGGQIRMELQETFWAQRFAMFTDRFGTPWMINCAKPM
ncbi:MAG TPA: VOC family protein [Terriglobales bacterium]|nr:VOC family protein [Terriglobales bacterium]